MHYFAYVCELLCTWASEHEIKPVAVCHCSDAGSGSLMLRVAHWVCRCDGTVQLRHRLSIHAGARQCELRSVHSKRAPRYRSCFSLLSSGLAGDARSAEKIMHTHHCHSDNATSRCLQLARVFRLSLC